MFKNNRLLLVGLFVFLFPWASAFATGIDTTNSYAWGENVGWLNFGTSQGNVDVGTSALTGYAWGENVGWVSLNCLNTSSCVTVSYSVANDGAGNLSGYAWGENIGWLSFSCSNTSSCGTGGGKATYGVTVDTSGNFSGFAYGENVGWVSFNCSNTSSCGTVSYKVALVAGAAATPTVTPQASQTFNNSISPAALPQVPNPATIVMTTPPPQSAVIYVTSPTLPPPRFVPSAPPIIINGNSGAVTPPSNNVQSGGVKLRAIVNGIGVAAIAVKNAIVSNVKKAFDFIGNLFSITPRKIPFSPPQAVAPSSSSPSVLQNIGDQTKNIFDYIKNLILPH